MPDFSGEIVITGKAPANNTLYNVCAVPWGVFSVQYREGVS